MNTLELNIKNMIIEKYGSLKKFADKINMSWSTLDSILKRGFINSNINNVIRITEELNISAEALAEGNITEKKYAISFEELTTIENDIITKFRLLDIRGQQSVLDTIERELIYKNKE